MFESRSPRNFNSAPQSVTAFIATVLEPAITVLVYLGALAWHGEDVGRADLTLCFLVLALTFPGINRFRDRLSSAAVGILGSWLTLLAILLGFGYGTRSLDLFQHDVMLFWAVITPVLQLAAVRLGYKAIRRQARDPGNRRSAVVIGAGALGVKVAHALASSPTQGVDFLGYFDDRADARVHASTLNQRLGNLLDAAPYIRAHGIKEVFITLPLGSQPRIIDLLEHLQGTTASIYFVPDVFGISIIQGRLQDMSGVPVVGICETPFTGTNRLIKRVSDIVLSILILLLIFPIMIAVAVGVRRLLPT